LALVLAVVSYAASAETLIMPRGLVDFARSNGCATIDDFFERPGMLDPPYVYGVLAGDKEDSVAFWCKKLEKSDKPYMLVIKATDPNELNGCPAKIDWWNYPRGLSIEMRSALALNSFHYVTDPKRAGPAATVPKAKVIVSYYDGVSEMFYCYKSEWLFAIAD
jgi:hypothetical protein